MSATRRILTGVASLAAGVTAIVYSIFSIRVMPELAEMPVAEGVARMQSFNRDAEQAPFMLAFFGAAALSVGALITAGREPEPGRRRAMRVAAIAYLAGFLLTIVVNVPRNTAIAYLDPNAPETTTLWPQLHAVWDRSNGVRAVLSSVATVAFAAVALPWRRRRAPRVGAPRG